MRSAGCVRKPGCIAWCENHRLIPAAGAIPPSVPCSCHRKLDDNVEIEIDPSEVRTDTYRASGAGGQHVNKTDSAVRLTHASSGIVVQCQSERSQHQNRDRAWKMLRARLYEQEMLFRSERAQAVEDSKSDIGWGRQIRSYVLDDQRIKDLRTGVETSNTQNVLDGGIDQFIEASLKSGL